MTRTCAGTGKTIFKSDNVSLIQIRKVWNTLRHQPVTAGFGNKQAGI